LAQAGFCCPRVFCLYLCTMKLIVLLFAVAAVQATRHLGTDSTQSCQKRDLAMRVLMQLKLEALGVPCENMCKKMGAYPNCQCPGFAGQPASSDDDRACYAKYCQDPSAPCPNDAFTTCVSEVTQISALQWDSVMENFDKVQLKKPHTSLVAVKQGCSKKDLAVRVLLQEKVRGIPCENMCKEMGAYPDCQCPGFAGQPAAGDDNRACIAKYCQDPTSPCPNDAFVTCVKENTEVSALQWDAVFAQITDGVSSITKMLKHKRAANNTKF